MKYRLLLLDIDGTLTASKGDALPSTPVVKAVQAAQEELTVAVATGRAQSFSQSVLNALQLHGYGIFNGGADIVNTTTRRIVAQQFVSVKQLRELVALALPFGYSIFTDHDQYGVPLQSADEVKKSAAKLFIEAVKTKDVPHMIDQLNSVDDVIAHPTSSWTDGDVLDIHVNHALATKRHGAEHLAKLLGIKKTEIIAIGDGYNDVPLLEAAGLKIAMGNAPDEVKAIADYVAPSLENDGVVDCIEKFILGA